jgi:hypothetical protein
MWSCEAMTMTVIAVFTRDPRVHEVRPGSGSRVTAVPPDVQQRRK